MLLNPQKTILQIGILHIESLHGKEPRATRPFRRCAGNDDSAVVAGETDARLRAGKTYQGSFGPPAAGGRGLAVPGTAKDAERGFARIGDWDVGKGATHADLPAD